MKGKGFSLVELLTSIGIIGVLTAVLLPSLSQARRYAKVMQCQQAQRAMHLNFNILCEEMFPQGVNRSQLQDKGKEWESRIVNYAGQWHPDAYLGENYKRFELLNCPDAREAQIMNPVEFWSLPIGEFNPDGKSKALVTYTGNLEYLIHNRGVLSEIPSVWERCEPVETARDYQLGTEKQKHYFPDIVSEITFRQNMLHQGYREMPGANYVFADGHGAYRTVKEVYKPELQVEKPKN